MAWSIVLIGLLNTIYSWFRAPAKFSSNVVRSRDKCTSDWVNLSIPRNMDRNMDRWLHFSALVIVVLAIAQGITYILSAEYCAMFLSLQVTVSANRTLFFLGLIVFSQRPCWQSITLSSSTENGIPSNDTSLIPPSFFFQYTRTTEVVGTRYLKSQIPIADQRKPAKRLESCTCL